MVVCFWILVVCAWTCVLSTDDFLIHFSGFLYRTVTAFLCFQHALIDACQTPPYLHLANKYLLRHFLAHVLYFVGSLFYTKNVSNQLPPKTTHYHNWFKSSVSLQPTVASFLAFHELSTRQTPGLTDTKSASQKTAFSAPFFVGRLVSCLIVWFLILRSVFGEAMSVVGAFGTHISTRKSTLLRLMGKKQRNLLGMEEEKDTGSINQVE